MKDIAGEVGNSYIASSEALPTFLDSPSYPIKVPLPHRYLNLGVTPYLFLPLVAPPPH